MSATKNDGCHARKRFAMAARQLPTGIEPLRRSRTMVISG
jgi:hypothetical protein